MKQCGISFFGALGLIFIVLKLTDNIDWSWGCVLSPIWIPISLSLFFWFLIGFFAWNACRIRRKEQAKRDEMLRSLYD